MEFRRNVLMYKIVQFHLNKNNKNNYIVAIFFIIFLDIHYFMSLHEFISLTHSREFELSSRNKNGMQLKIIRFHHLRGHNISVHRISIRSKMKIIPN